MKPNRLQLAENPLANQSQLALSEPMRPVLNTSALVPKNRHTMLELLKPLTQSNWLQARVEIMDKQPNLSQLVACLDLLLPVIPGTSIHLAGYEIQAFETFQGGCPQFLNIKKSEYPQGEVDNSSNLSTLQRVRSIIPNPWQAPKKAANAETTLIFPFENEILRKGIKKSLVREEVFRKLVCVLIDQTKHATPFAKTEGVIDITSETLSRIVQVILPHAQTELTENWLGDIKRALSLSKNESHQVNPAYLLPAQIERVSKLHPKLITLIMSLDMSTFPSKGRINDGAELFPILDEEDYMYARGAISKKNAENPYFQTHLSNLGRHAVVGRLEEYYLNRHDFEKYPVWVYKQEGREAISFLEKGGVISSMAHEASVQLLFTEPNHECAANDLFPIHILKLVAEIKGQPIPEWVSTHHNNILKAKSEYEKEASRQKAIATEQKQQKELANKRASAESHARIQQRGIEIGLPRHLINNLDILDLACLGTNHKKINANTIDIQVPVPEALNTEIKLVLGDYFEHLNLAHNRRGVKVIEAFDLHKGGFMRDNQCWLRATWLSVFEQLQSSNELVQRVEGAEIKSRIDNKRILAVLGLIFRGYQKSDDIPGYSRLGFLHHGEEEKTSNAPAHFRTGQNLTEFCNDFGFENILKQAPEVFSLKDNEDLPEVEDQLRDATLRLSTGVYEALREIYALSQVYGMNSMATSDVPAATHRALGLPCIIVEHDKSYNTFNLRVAVPKNHVLNDILKNVPTDREGSPKLDQASIQALLTQAQVPVMYLESLAHNDGHFTLYLPKQSTLAKQIQFAKETEGFTQDPISEFHKMIEAQQEYVPKGMEIDPELDSKLPARVDRPVAQQPANDPPGKVAQLASLFEAQAQAKAESVVVDTAAGLEFMDIEKPGPKVEAALLHESFSKMVFPNSNSFHVLATRELDRTQPTLILDQAIALSPSNPVIFDFDSEKNLKRIGDTLLPLSDRLKAVSRSAGLQITQQVQLEGLGKPAGVHRYIPRHKPVKMEVNPNYQVYKIKVADGLNEPVEVTLIEFKWIVVKDQFNRVEKEGLLKAANAALNRYLTDDSHPLIRSSTSEKPQTALSVLNQYKRLGSESELMVKEFFDSNQVPGASQTQSLDLKTEGAKQLMNVAYKLAVLD